MWSYLLLAGAALIVLAALLLMAALAATRAPRGAAIALVLGLAAVAGAAWTSPQPLTLSSIGVAWSELRASAAP